MSAGNSLSSSAQQAALQQFRNALTAEGTVKLWGVEIGAAGPAGRKQNVVCAKFLRARGWDVDKAVAMAQACLKAGTRHMQAHAPPLL